MAATRARAAHAMRAAALGIAVAALVVSLLPPLPVAASELPADSEGSSAQSVVMSPKRMDLALGKSDSHHVWVNSQAKLAYFLSGQLSNDGGYAAIAAVDTEGGGIVARSPLVQHAYATMQNQRYGSGYDDTIAIDEAGGRIFVATTAGLTTRTTDHSRVDQGRVCGGIGFAEFHCLTGVSVLNAVTLEHIRHIPLRSVQVDAPMVGPQLLAMSYAPAVGDLPPKIHVVMQESPYTTYLGDNFAQQRWNSRQAYNSTFVVQLDPDSGQQDWVVRLDACRGAPSGASVKQNAERANSPHRAAVFRSRAPEDRAVFVACLTAPQSYTAGVVRVPLDEHGMATARTVPAVPSEAPAAEPPHEPAAMTPRIDRPFTVEGPDRVQEILADPVSGRIAMQVRDGQPTAMVWYVFDAKVMQFVGTIGIGGPVLHQTVLAGVSGEGRLYTLTAPATSGSGTFAGGLFVADLRRTPVPQALLFQEFAAHFPEMGAASDGAWFRYGLSSQNLPGGGSRLWMPSKLDRAGRPAYIAIEDLRPVDEPLPPDMAGRSLDIEEEAGATESTFDGVARGYGFRALLIGGAEAAARLGPLDPVGLVAQCQDQDWRQDDQKALDPWDLAADGANTAYNRLDGSKTDRQGPCYRAGVPLPTQCVDGSREVVLAFAGPREPAIVDSTGARGAAEPFYVDALTTTDANAPVSRCTGKDWDEVWSTALFGSAPAEEPSGRGASERTRLLAQCLSSSEGTSDQNGDPVTRGYSAAVTCEQESATGHAYARGFAMEGVTVSEALSSFRVYRDAGRGIVSRVESVARGINVPGLLRIDTVRGVAESWANGRAFLPPTPEEGQIYDPNCDFERTAGTCFQRHLFGMWTPGFSCGPCGDEQAFVGGANAILNPYMSLRLRDPDQRLRIGTDNGFAAAIQKPEHERFADLVLNLDLMQTTLPTLEVIRHAPPNRLASRQGARGRQIYQFAGVEVSSSYGISCLLVYDEASNTCAGEKLEPGAIQVSLSDSDGKPLAGGGFEVRQDVDADGVLGLKDTLLPNGACVTADDGIGTCTFDALQPGSYLVSQVAAPPGYANSAEPFVVELASGEQRTVAFTNVSNMSTVDIKATDENGAPLSGATFVAYPDPDSDGKVAPEAKPAAECTTDGQGACQMKVPAGSYVLVQTSAPGGLEAIEPVAFTFASGGQVAAVSVVNYPPGAPEAPQAPASPVYTPPVDQAPPTEIFDDGYVAPTPVADSIGETGVNLPERISGTVTQVIRAPGDALRLLARDPKQAIAWTAALALFVLAAMAVRRRQHVRDLLQSR